LWDKVVDLIFVLFFVCVFFFLYSVLDFRLNQNN